MLFAYKTSENYDVVAMQNYPTDQELNRQLIKRIDEYKNC